MRLELIAEDRWNILAICGKTGPSHLRNFLEGLEKQYHGSRTGMIAYFEHFAFNGPIRRTDLSHDIGDGIWQLTKGDLRAPYFYGNHQRHSIVITHSFLKDSQATPPKQKTRAVNLRQDYFDAVANDDIIIVG